MIKRERTVQKGTDLSNQNNQIWMCILFVNFRNSILLVNRARQMIYKR